MARRGRTVRRMIWYWLSHSAGLSGKNSSTPSSRTSCPSVTPRRAAQSPRKKSLSKHNRGWRAEGPRGASDAAASLLALCWTLSEAFGVTWIYQHASDVSKTQQFERVRVGCVSYLLSSHGTLCRMVIGLSPCREGSSIWFESIMTYFTATIIITHFFKLCCKNKNWLQFQNYYACLSWQLFFVITYLNFQW